MARSELCALVLRVSDCRYRLANRFGVSRRSGFTLIEVLVVIAIIATLAALLLPAVASVREAGRRVQCGNNLKQLALALHNYHAVHGIFPPSMQASSSDPMPENSSRSHANWIITILPFIEEQALYDTFDFKTKLDAMNSTSTPTPNALATATDISSLRCPADFGHETKFKDGVGFRGPSAGGPGVIYQYWARGNYAANGCLGFPFRYSPPTAQIAPACGWRDQMQWSGPESRKSRGVMGTNVSLTIKQITDGTSNTALLSEVRVGVNELDVRGTWANGNPGGSSLWGHYNGPNWIADGIGTCDPVQKLAGGGNIDRGTELMLRDGMGCHDPNYNSIYSGNPKSRHPGGIMVALADGSVRFVSDHVEHCEHSAHPYSWQPFVIPVLFAWERLWASGDGLALDFNKLE